MRTLDFAFDSTLKRLHKLKTYTDVDFYSFEIDSKPLVSCAYTCCIALIVQNEYRAALAHMHPEENIEDYTTPIIDKMGVNPRELKTAIVAGSKTKHIEGYLRRIGTQFLEAGHTRYNRREHRDIIVIPSRQKFLICMDNKVIGLSFNPGKRNKVQIYS